MDASIVSHACLGARLRLQSYYYPNLWRALTASVDSCAEIKSAPSVAEENRAEFGGRCRKAMFGVWERPSVSVLERSNACAHGRMITTTNL